MAGRGTHIAGTLYPAGGHPHVECSTVTWKSPRRSSRRETLAYNIHCISPLLLAITFFKLDLLQRASSRLHYCRTTIQRAGHVYHNLHQWIHVDYYLDNIKIFPTTKLPVSPQEKSTVLGGMFINEGAAFYSCTLGYASPSLSLLLGSYERVGWVMSPQPTFQASHAENGEQRVYAAGLRWALWLPIIVTHMIEMSAEKLLVPWQRRDNELCWHRHRIATRYITAWYVLPV